MEWKLDEIADQMGDYQIAIAEMEIRGVPVDMEMVERYKIEAAEKADELEARIQELADYPINPRSPKQLKAWLGTAGTAKDILEPMAERGKTGCQEILDYRQWQRMGSAYYTPYTMCQVNGRIHASPAPYGHRYGTPLVLEPEHASHPAQK